jgi:hypothetical protein
MAAFVSFVLSECGEMNEVDVRRVLGRRVVTGEIVMAVLHAVRMWGGVSCSEVGDWSKLQ